MKRRKWDAKTNATIVLEGLKGKPVAAICTDYQLSQAQYYQWRDQLLHHAAKAFEVAQQSQREARLQQENVRLKTLVGELTLELKKKRRGLAMTRQPSVRVAQRNAPLVDRIRMLKAEHPFWGYRRIWAYLRFTDGLAVNKKRILRLLRQHHLVVKPNLRLKATRTPQRSKPRPTQPNQWWGIDMTKVLVDPVGWVYLVLVLDWHTKKIVGHYAGLQATAQHWLIALDQAVSRQCSQGVRDQGLSLMSDNGCQPTSVAFMKTCATLGIHQAFTSYNNPKGNADTERLMRTLKEELVWLREWTSPVELERALAAWIDWYNSRYRHSALGYQTPVEFERHYYLSHSSQFVAA